MPNLTLEQWSQLAEVAVTLVASLGIVTSLWMSVKALREVQKDRDLRHKPYLAFNPGAGIVPVEFVHRGRALPGVDRRYAEQVLASIPRDAESVAIKDEQVQVTEKGALHQKSGVDTEDGSSLPNKTPPLASYCDCCGSPEEGSELVRPLHYGRLKNYGLGPALATHIRWVPEKVTIGAESFKIDERKLREPVYSYQLNTMPASPQHIEPNGEGEAQLTRLPAFIAKDFEKKVTVVVGRLVITCKDIFGRNHLAIQEFRIRTDYSREQPHLLVTFSDILGHDEEHGVK